MTASAPAPAAVSGRTSGGAVGDWRERVEGRLAGIEGLVPHLATRADVQVAHTAIEATRAGLEKQISTQTRWLAGLLIGLLVVLLGALVAGYWQLAGLISAVLG